MHRAVLESLFPWMLALAAAVAALWLTVRASGARWQWRRFRSLHACQAGSVQSLSFVLTLPVFMMLVLFIIQISQYMIAKTVVHYAAFAAARSAMVWLPALTTNGEAANQVDPALSLPRYPNEPSVWEVPQIGREGIDPRMKYYKIWAAAVMACAPVSPSKPMYPPLTDRTIPETYRRLYASLAPASTSNPRIPDRIENKLSYSSWNTVVQILGLNRDSRSGPTYNPYPGRNTWQTDPLSGEQVLVFVPWQPHEIGWQDAMTVTVTHDFALLPGIGKILSIALGNSGGVQDTVSPRIQQQTDAQYAPQSGLYTTKITGTVTLSNEGLKSLFPYAQTLD